MPWAYADSRVALMLRRLRARFGVAAPRVAVSVELPLYLKVWMGVLFVAIASGLIWLAYDSGRHGTRFLSSDDESTLESMRHANAALEDDVARFRALLAASESSLQIERAAQRSLSEKNASLQDENSRLKEELAVIEKLVRMDGQTDDRVSLDRISLKQDGSTGKYRWSFVVELEGKRRGSEAKLNLQMVVTMRGGDKITLPQGQDPNDTQYQFAVRNYRRVDGKFSLPAGGVISSVEFRILESGALKVSKVHVLPLQ